MNKIVINNHGDISTITANNQVVTLNAPASTGVYGSLSEGVISLQQGYTTKTIDSIIQDNLEKLEEDAANNGGFYISKINGVLGTPDISDTFPKTVGGRFSIVGGNTTDILPFAETANSVGLTIDDFGRPNIDCDDYAKLYKLSSRLDDYLENVKTQIIGKPSESGHVSSIYGVHKQYQSVIRLWNNLVQLSSIRANVTYQNKHIFVQISITNNTDSDIVDFETPISVEFKRSPNPANPSLFIRFDKADAYINNSNFSDAQVNVENDNYTLVCSNFPAGSTITASLQYRVSTTASSETTIITYELSDIKEARVRVIPGLNTRPPQTHSQFETYYDYPGIGGQSAISTGTVAITPRGDYTEDDKGNYIINILTTGTNPSFSITGPAGTPINAANVGTISLNGMFTEGDRFSFTIYPKVEILDIQPIKKETLDAVITLMNIPVAGDFIDKVTKTRSVYLTDEESTVGILSATVIPDIQVVGMDVVGGALSQGSISMGTISIGTVSIGTISIGSVATGSVIVGEIIVEDVVVKHTVSGPSITYTSVSLEASVTYTDGNGSTGGGS